MTKPLSERIAKAKPGSILGDGTIIDYRGVPYLNGPCFINPLDIPIRITIHRFRAFDEAGWRMVPAAFWPSMLPFQGALCIGRGPVLTAVKQWAIKHITALQEKERHD